MVLLLHKWFLIVWIAGFANSTANSSNKGDGYHPFYVSVTEINHNAGDKNLEISCKIFTDDFETALSKSTGVKIDLFNPKDKQVADRLIAAYLKKHLNIKLDNKPANLEFVGFERENEAVWSYLQVSNTSAPKKVDISNQLLYESFNQQIHLIHVSVGNTRKSTKLNYPDSNTSFQF